MSELKLTVLYGTETGNCRGVAEKVAKKGAKNGVEVDVHDLAEYTLDELKAVENPVLIVISTWDDGMPPPKAAPFCNSLMTSEESFSNLRYTVLALGDQEYPLYCECGKQVDAQLAALGAARLLDRTDLGADFMVSYIGWSKQFWKAMAKVYGVVA